MHLYVWNPRVNPVLHFLVCLYGGSEFACPMMHHVKSFLGAWETTNRSTCPEDPTGSLRPGQVPVAAQVLEDLPGSVPELTEERPIIHNTQFDQYNESTAGKTSRPTTHAHAITEVFYFTHFLHKICNKTILRIRSIKTCMWCPNQMETKHSYTDNSLKSALFWVIWLCVLTQ